MNFGKQNFSNFSLAFEKAQYIICTTKNDRKLENTVKRKTNGVTITNLSKVLNLNLLVAKLKAYGLDSNATSFIKSHHTNRYQPCKTGDSFSEWERIIAGVPQRSILVPLLFNIFVNEFFIY